ncbi:MAG TPA: metallophosphoesterase family protein [Anaerolineales bacterium]|nr:metallophosphoesterase family protein [Anaerolineales bacterium]
MKIAVITDAHANLPALNAVLKAIRADACDSIFHLGDALAIGPYPGECIDLMQSTPNLTCVLGNHDLYFVNGLPNPQPNWMSDGEVQHQLWTHEQLGDQRKSIISQWPFVHEDVFERVKTVFVHYGFAGSRNDFIGVVRHPNGIDMDKMFSEFRAEILFFGHDHSPSDVRGKARYINPGSLGCCSQAFARYTIAKFVDGQVDIQHCSVSYDDKELYEAFEDRKVPEKEFIYKVFFGGRFGS